MNFFQRIGNALSRFMYGRNGADRLGLTMIWTALLLDVINIFLRDKAVVYSIISFVSGIIVLAALFRMFSRNLEKRRAENARFSSVERERSSSRMRSGAMPMDTSVSRMHCASVIGSLSSMPPEATHTASGWADR